MEYPDKHRKIVEELMGGKFILSREPHFEHLKNAESFYTDFFHKSFGYDLFITQEFAYIISQETDENLSRDISVFFAILCFELDKQGKHFLDDLKYAEQSFEEVNLLFENSSYIDLIRSNNQLRNIESRKKLIMSSMNRRNIVEKINDDKFYFTPAYQVFIDFAKELGTSLTNSIDKI